MSTPVPDVGRRPGRSVASGRASGAARTMGYQPGLDGIRAISVVAVILYHGGFSWITGGFIGVEVFFVVSGFLITSLLLDERERRGAVSLGRFWQRRARRLLPALFTLFVAVTVTVALFGSAAQTSELRRDLPWALGYLANWGQIFGDVPYFAPTDPPLLRQLWSLAVEEQWYVVWPLVFVGISGLAWTAGRTAAAIAGASLGVMVVTAWWALPSSSVLGGPPSWFDGVDRVNFLYLSTITRSSGLLLGAATAFVWRPWRSARAVDAPARPLDLAAGIGLGILVCVSIAAHVTDRSLYQWVLPLATVASLVVVLAVVHPAAVGTRALLSAGWLVAIGRRSYGLYLWHWPVLVLFGATGGSAWRFVPAMVVAVALSEACFRWIETPIRVDGLRGWWAGLAPVRLAPLGAAALVAVTVVSWFSIWGAEPYDPAVGGDEVAFELATGDGAADPDRSVPGASVPDASVPDDSIAPTTTAPAPVRLAILGDSQAHSLALNLPSGIEETFAVTNGAIPGCGVLDRGRVRSDRESFSNDFGICRGWQEQWAEAASGTDVALVFLGAWDVFDVEVDGTLVGFDTPAGDELFTSSLRSGIDAVRAEGVEVALLEVPCMRPVSAEGAAVPPLPERADDARVAHLNELLRQVAASTPDDVSFVEGPDEWCEDEAIATDLGYRWDGVHVFRPGANLIYSTVAPALLTLAGRT